MTNKEKLNSYIEACERIEDLEASLEKWLAKATYMTSMMSDLPYGVNKQGLDDIVIKYISICADLKVEIDRSIKIKWKVDDWINTISNPDAKRVMRLRYIDGLKWKEIFARMGYEEAQIYRLHNVGLDTLGVK